MAEKKVTVTTEDNITTEPYVAREEDLLRKYSKPILYAAGVIIFLVAAWFGYEKLVREPKEQKSAEIIFPAESLFDKMATTGFNADSVNLVLNGGNSEGMKVTGLLNVLKNYGGTPAANRASYMVGAAYLHIRNFDKAIKHLKDFDANGATQIEIKKYTLLGHAYAEQNKKDDALSAYKKAASVNEKDDVFTADALMTAASYAESIGKTNDAIELYKKTKDNYPAAPAVQGGDVDKYLARLGVTNDNNDRK